MKRYVDAQEWDGGLATLQSDIVRELPRGCHLPTDHFHDFMRLDNQMRLSLTRELIAQFPQDPKRSELQPPSLAYPQTTNIPKITHMSSAYVLLRPDVMIDHFEKQLRLLTDDTYKLLECPLVKF